MIIGVELLHVDYESFYLLTTSREPLAKSTTPATGLTTRPTAPLPKPLKKPSTPCSLAPVTGLVITPVTPE